jgi:hypothetical protein
MAKGFRHQIKQDHYHAVVASARLGEALAARNG